MVLMKYFLNDSYEFVQMPEPSSREMYRLEGSGLYMIIAAPGVDPDAFQKKLYDFERWQDKTPVDDKTYKLSQVLPVYIGQTSNLRNRCTQHISSNDGSSKLNQCKSLGGIGRNLKIYFLCRMMTPSSAKFMESVFLRTYDFALNEDGQKRRRQFLVLQDRKLFCEAYQNEEKRSLALKHYKDSKNLLKKILNEEDRSVKKELSCADEICKKHNNWSAGY